MRVVGDLTDPKKSMKHGREECSKECHIIIGKVQFGYRRNEPAEFPKRQGMAIIRFRRVGSLKTFEHLRQKVIISGR